MEIWGHKLGSRIAQMRMTGEGRVKKEEQKGGEGGVKEKRRERERVVLGGNVVGGSARVVLPRGA